MRVTVVTPTTGNPLLNDCINSVKNQTYKNVDHLIVIDGLDRKNAADKVLSGVWSNDVNIIQLPYSVGTNRYNGHRIYGATSFLIEGDYVIWLDEDNVLETNHIESLVKIVSENNLDWAYSLRKIVNHSNEFICLDDCESLGMWNSVLDEKDFFIDVNCFFVKKSIAVQISPLWHRKFREPGQPEVDRVISAVLLNKDNKLKYECTRDYTVRYRVGNTTLSVTSDFFVKGNAAMYKLRKGVLPWKV